MARKSSLKPVGVPLIWHQLDTVTFPKGVHKNETHMLQTGMYLSKPQYLTGKHFGPTAPTWNLSI